MSVKRGDIYYADLSPVVGSEQGGLRPVLIIQNDVGNKYSPTVIAAAMLGKIKTFSQSVCIIYMLVSDVVFPPSLGFVFEYHIIDYVCLIFTVVMTIISGLQYMQKYFKYIDPTE